MEGVTLGSAAWFRFAAVVLTPPLLIGSQCVPNPIFVGFLTSLIVAKILSPAEAVAGLGNRVYGISWLNVPAYACPCRRFAHPLADTNV